MAITGETPQPEASLAKLGSGLDSFDQSPKPELQTEADIQKPNLGLGDSVSKDLKEQDSLKRAICRSDRSPTNKPNVGVSLTLAQDQTHTFLTFGDNADIHFTRSTTSLVSDGKRPPTHVPFLFHNKTQQSHQDLKASMATALLIPKFSKNIDIHFTTSVSSPPALNKRHSTFHGRLHFHRKQHYGHHDHKSSTPAPFTFTKGRKYILSDRTADPALTRSQEPVPDIEDLTHALRRSNLSSNPAPRELTPGEIAHRLRHWTYDPYMAAESEKRERQNPFPGVDMNIGWNRARCNSALCFAEQLEWMNVHEGGPEATMRAKECLNSFSFWAQLEPIELDAEEIKGMFDRVFVGEGCGRFGWARMPGSWWATRKGVFAGDRGVCFITHVKEQTKEIAGKVIVWRRTRAVGESKAASLKRKGFREDVDKNGGNLTSRKRQAVSKASEEVMGEKWRARRREQEKKAGRWTDGTLWMNRLWEEFHWVLDN